MRRLAAKLAPNADAAADLRLRTRDREQLADDVEVVPASECGVEIDDVQATTTLIKPMLGHLHRIVGVDCGIFHPALAQTYAPTFFQVYGRYQQHLKRAFRRRYNSGHTFIGGDRHAQGSAKGFEQGFGLMVGVLTLEIIQVQRHHGVINEALEKFTQ